MNRSMNKIQTAQATLSHPHDDADADENPRIHYLIGVDGGGTGTRVVLADQNGVELGRGVGGPSGLVHGRQQAWDAILDAMKQAFDDAGIPVPSLHHLAIGCGLAGVNNVQWAGEFVRLNPGFRELIAETDAYTTLLGAHNGQPGAVIALGTGSVGEVLLATGQRREVGGWGFPASDEASGAWIGLHAMNYLQRTLDGRQTATAFSAALLAHCGGEKDAVFNWLAAANQTRYAALAPIVIQFASKGEKAREILLAAGREVEIMATALDPTGALPIALCGGLAHVLHPYLPSTLQQRAQRPLRDSAGGAVILIQHHLKKI